METGEYKGYNIKSAIKSGISKIAMATGRATLSEFWYCVLCSFLVSIFFSFFFIVINAINLVNLFLGSQELLILLQIALFVSLLTAVTARRLHDAGKSGAFIFLFFIPIIGWLVVLSFLLQDSQKGTNEYGPSEKYPKA